MALLQQSQPQTQQHSVNSVQNNSVNNAGTSLPLQWILDSGATDHVCPFRSLFIDFHPIQPISIRMPNDTFVSAQLSETVKLGSLYLHDTLYIPNFSVHLISIPKLVCDPNYLIIFCHNNCLIMRKSPFQRIGLASKIKGLFYLKDSTIGVPSAANLVSQATDFSLNTCNNCTHFDQCKPISSTDKASLWHLRLGHFPILLCFKFVNKI
jgi:hypothetical protein